MSALQNKKLAALEEYTNFLKALDSQQQSSFLDDRAALLSPTLSPAITLKDDRGKFLL